MARFLAVLAAGVMATGWLGGCASSQMSRIDRNRHVYETWPIEIRQSVLDGKVEPGMTPEMVRVAWGEPTEVVVQAQPGDEIWVYQKGGIDRMSSRYPGTGISGGMGGGGIGIVTGRGGTGVGVITGVGVGGSPVGMGGSSVGMGGPVMSTPSPVEIREVVFRDGIVHRADPP